MSINGGTVTTLASGLNGPAGINVDATNLYWMDSDAVKKIGINGGMVTTLASGLNGPVDMTVDATNVYWTEGTGGTVKKVAKDPDSDEDSVPDANDICPFTAIGEVVDPATGCSIDQLCPCASPRGTTTAWKNHGQYASCVAKSSENFVLQGLMTETQKGTVVSQAANSSCGSNK